MKKALLFAIFVFILAASQSFAATRTVTNCADSGPGSLRQAITDAGAGDQIIFDITTAEAGYSTGEAGPGLVTNEAGGNTWFRIIVNSTLPTITVNNVYIRGLTQTREANNSAGPSVEVRANGIFDIFFVNSSSVTIEGLTINRCGGLDGGSGIKLSSGSANNCRIYGCYIGPSASGEGYAPNKHDYGVYISGGSGNIIGGITTAERNVISGNTNIGVYIGSSISNEVKGNYIGTTATGEAGLANGTGVWIDGGSSGNIIGGITTAERNVISGNTDCGVAINSSASNEVKGNYIGTDASGAAQIKNTRYGIYIKNSAALNKIGPSNMIAYNGNASYPDGIRVDGATTTSETITQNSIFSNYGKGIALVSGANNGIASPEISSSAYNQLTGLLQITGTATPNAVVEIFKAQGNQGKTYLGYLTANGSGEINGSLTYPGLISGDALVATATDAINNTSEFGPAKEVNITITPTQPAPGNTVRFGPNPYNPNNGSGRFWYWLTADKDTSIYLIDLSGTIVWKKTYPSGTNGGKSGENNVEYDGKTSWRDALGNGVYLYKIVQDGKSVGGGKIAVIK